MSLSTVPAQKKYGLITKAKPQPPQRKIVKPAIFSQDDDDDDDANEREIARATRAMLSAGSSFKSNEEIEEYDFDGTYDEMKKQQLSEAAVFKNKAPDAPKARYITQLKATAAVREREHDRIYERKLLKERQQEDALHGDTPKFVTSAYKKKLQESAQWDAEDKLNEVIEAKTDVRGSGMMGFYSNLLTKNIAMGSSVESSAISAYTAGSDRQKMKLDPTSSHAADTSAHESNKKTTKGDEREHSEERRVRQRTEEQPSSSVATENVLAATDSAPVEKPAEPAVPVISKEEKILSAKERYLARKNKQS